jgi:hypothetical protein
MYSILNETELKSLPSDHVLYFYATWLPKGIVVNSRNMVEQVSTENGITALAIDVESFRGICKVNDITRVPTILLFRGKDMVKKLEGHMLTSAFRAAMREVYGDDILKNGRNHNDET